MTTPPRYKSLDPRQVFCGSIYGVVPAHRGYLRPQSQWNFEQVTIKGSTIKVELNGTVIVNARMCATIHDLMHKSAHPGLLRTTGSFGFAGHTDPVEFPEYSD